MIASRYGHGLEPLAMLPNADGLRFGISHLWSIHDSGWVVCIEEDDYWDNGRVQFRPEQIDAWIAAHPKLYPSPLDEHQRLVWPLVDHMMEKVVEYAIPYFEKVAAEYGIAWRCSIKSPY
jgi:hypothetical protein